MKINKVNYFYKVNSNSSACAKLVSQKSVTYWLMVSDHCRSQSKVPRIRRIIRKATSKWLMCSFSIDPKIPLVLSKWLVPPTEVPRDQLNAILLTVQLCHTLLTLCHAALTVYLYCTHALINSNDGHCRINFILSFVLIIVNKAVGHCHCRWNEWI